MIFLRFFRFSFLVKFSHQFISIPSNQTSNDDDDDDDDELEFNDASTLLGH